MGGEWLSWHTQDEYVRLFFIYLFAALITSVSRALKVSLRYFSLSKSQAVSLDTLCDGSSDAIMLADSALRNRLLYVPRTDIRDHANTSAGLAERLALRTADSADSRFLYLWEKSCATVKSLRRLALFTFLLSCTLLSYRLSLLLHGEFASEGKSSVFVLMLQHIAQLFAVFFLGLLVATFLYALSSVLIGALRRRKIAWQYFYARVRSDLFHQV